MNLKFNCFVDNYERIVIKDNESKGLMFQVCGENGASMIMITEEEKEQLLNALLKDKELKKEDSSIYDDGIYYTCNSGLKLMNCAVDAIIISKSKGSPFINKIMVLDTSKLKKYLNTHDEYITSHANLKVVND